MHVHVGLADSAAMYAKTTAARIVPPPKSAAIYAAPSAHALALQPAYTASEFNSMEVFEVCELWRMHSAAR